MKHINDQGALLARMERLCVAIGCSIDIALSLPEVVPTVAAVHTPSIVEAQAVCATPEGSKLLSPTAARSPFSDASLHHESSSPHHTTRKPQLRTTSAAALQQLSHAVMSERSGCVSVGSSASVFVFPRNDSHYGHVAGEALSSPAPRESAPVVIPPLPLIRPALWCSDHDEEDHITPGVELSQKLTESVQRATSDARGRSREDDRSKASDDDDIQSLLALEERMLRKDCSSSTVVLLKPFLSARKAAGGSLLSHRGALPHSSRGLAASSGNELAEPIAPPAVVITIEQVTGLP